MSQFGYKLEYVPGKQNVMADPLSRIYDFKVAIISASVGSADLYAQMAAVDVLALPSDREWVEEQHKDIEWYPMIRWIDTGCLPDDDQAAQHVLAKAKNYALHGEHGILVKLREDSLGGVSTLQKVVPKKWRVLILAKYHDSIFKGTLAGRDKTLANVKENFHYTKMANYVDLYMHTCHVCQRVKDPTGAQKSWMPLGNIEAKFPNDLVSIDLWSPGIVSRSGNKYVLMIIDGFSKYANAIAIPNKKAETVAQALLSHFSIVGIPAQLHSDQGREFVNKIITQSLQGLGYSEVQYHCISPTG